MPWCDRTGMMSAQCLQHLAATGLFCYIKIFPQGISNSKYEHYIDGLVQETRNSSAFAIKLHHIDMWFFECSVGSKLYNDNMFTFENMMLCAPRLQFGAIYVCFYITAPIPPSAYHIDLLKKYRFESKLFTYDTYRNDTVESYMVNHVEWDIGCLWCKHSSFVITIKSLPFQGW